MWRLLATECGCAYWACAKIGEPVAMNVEEVRWRLMLRLAVGCVWQHGMLLATLACGSDHSVRMVVALKC